MARILVIDDDDNYRKALYRILKREGHEVQSAINGSEGIDLYRKNPTDLVITDILMPGKDGVATIQELQKNFPEVKIIAISGGGMVNTGEGYLGAAKFITHIRHVLTKPFSNEDLLRMVKELVG